MTDQLEHSALHDSVERARLAITIARLGTWYYDPQTELAALDDRMCAIWGEPSGAVLPIGSVMERVHPDDRAAVESAVAAALAGQDGGRFACEFRIVWPDTSLRWLTANGQAQFAPVGAEQRAVGFLGTALDITDRKLSEAALRDSEAKYRTLFTSIDEGYCLIELLFDAHGAPQDYRFVEINPVFEYQTGLRDAVGKTARELVPDLEDHWFAIYGRVALTGEAIRFENHSAPMQRWFDVYACRVGGAESRLVALVFKDITERKLAETERERLLEKTDRALRAAEAAVDARDQFLTIASHELRTPMTSVIGYAELLQRKAAAGASSDASRDRLVDNILRQARRLNNLLGQLFDVTQLEHGQLDLRRQPLELGELVERVVGDVRLGLGDADGKWPITLLCAAEPVPVDGDGERLEQVLTNLLSNAVKYSPDGGPIRVSMARDGADAVVEVADAGIGIPREAQARLFDVFFRAPNVGNVRGLGIGLHVVHAIVERHGGRIEVQSAPGHGSTFRVLLPLAATPA